MGSCVSLGDAVDGLCMPFLMGSLMSNPRLQTRAECQGSKAYNIYARDN